MMMRFTDLGVGHRVKRRSEKPEHNRERDQMEADGMHIDGMNDGPVGYTEPPGENGDNVISDDGRNHSDTDKEED